MYTGPVIAPQEGGFNIVPAETTNEPIECCFKVRVGPEGWVTLAGGPATITLGESYALAMVNLVRILSAVEMLGREIAQENSREKEISAMRLILGHSNVEITAEYAARQSAKKQDTGLGAS